MRAVAAGFAAAAAPAGLASLLGRRFAVGKEVLDGGARGAVQVHVAHDKLHDRAPGPDIFFDWVPAFDAFCVGTNGLSEARAMARPRGELRHLQQLQRLGELVGVDARRLLQLADVAFGERVEARRQRPPPELGARPLARHGVGRARRKRRPPPLPVPGPAADRGAADAGAPRDLAIGERRLFDQVAHLCDLGAAVRAARAGLARGGEGVVRRRDAGDGQAGHRIAAEGVNHLRNIYLAARECKRAADLAIPADKMENLLFGRMGEVMPPERGKPGPKIV